jgi:hypothetical protein
VGLTYDQAKALGIGHLHPAAERGRSAERELLDALDRPPPRPPRPSDGMNKTEARFGRRLDDLKARGVLREWAFEPEKFRLADRTWYRPDFRLVFPDGRVAFVEVKVRKKDGSVLWTDDGAVKAKAVAELHPYPFFLASYGEGGWIVARLPSRHYGWIGVDIEAWEWSP